jgi:hypothetical protein
MSKAGGGVRSNKVHSQGVRTGKPRHAVNPKWTSQIGSALGNHATNRTGMMPTSKVVERYRAGPAIASELGNTRALNVGGGGPGKGRQVYATGSQTVHGPAAGTPKPQGREILREFGPDSAGVKGR